MIKKINLFAAFIILNLVMASCGTAADNELTVDDSTFYKMVNENDSTQWVSLFDGQTLNGWHGFNKTAKVDNWMIEDSALVCLGAAIGDTGGDLVSENEYGNFELVWDWKMTKGGNSGVMYHVVEDAKYKAPYETGPEYQMIDDDNFEDKLENWQKTGANYAMNVPNNLKKVKPVGEWNRSRIIFNDGHVEHWLNGEKIVEFEAWTEAWEKEKTTGKWKDFPDYGSAKKGKIALQDHGHKVYFKNIRIKEL
jgi:hypothetical protein